MEIFGHSLDAIDVDALKENFRASKMSSTTEEQDIVDAISRMVVQQDKLIAIAEAHNVDIYANSSEDIYVNRRKIRYDRDITVVSGSVNIGTIGNDASSGLISPALLDDVYGSMFWRKGDYTQITNTLSVPRDILSDYDAMMTEDVFNGFFLQYGINEALSSCTVDYVGSVLPSNNQVINYSDTKEMFYLQSDIIDASVCSLHTPTYSIEFDTLSCSDIILPSHTTAKSIYTQSGGVSLEYFNSNFIRRDENLISDDATIEDGVDTNLVTVSGVISALSGYAPKTGWSPSDLVKTDSKSDNYLDAMVENIMKNNAPTDGNSLVSKKEIDYILEKIEKEIRENGLC